jgi:hypothetical protein
MLRFDPRYVCWGFADFLCFLAFLRDSYFTGYLTEKSSITLPVESDFQARCNCHSLLLEICTIE